MKLQKKFCTKFPSWDSLLENFNKSVVEKKDRIFKNNSFLASPNAIIIPEVKKLASEIGAKDAHLYMSFLPEAEGLGRHKDDMDVGFWQVKGKTLWKYEGESVILSEGDYLFIPKQTYHEAIGLSVRAGISFGF
tara:strand:+ start:159 stop:560 length:402 start_codon:yes stop_codon:yes gene_type:complete